MPRKAPAAPPPAPRTAAQVLAAELEMAQYHVQHELEDATAHVRYLRDRMAQLHTELTEDGVRAHISRNGEVQGQGLAVDMALARLAAAKEAYSSLQRIQAAMPTEDAVA